MELVSQSPIQALVSGLPCSAGEYTQERIYRLSLFVIKGNEGGGGSKIYFATVNLNSTLSLEELDCT